MTIKTLAIVRITALFATVAGSVALSFWLSSLHLRFVDIPLHTMMESLNGIFSLFLAFFIYKFNETDNLLNRYHIVALSLISIGVLSLIHAASFEGSMFVWCYVAGRLLGSFILLGLFLPERKISSSLFKSLPFVVIVVALGIALFIFFGGNEIPASEIGGTFTIWEKASNNVTAFFFFFGSLLFLRHYTREHQKVDFYFGAFFLLLSSTSFYFQFSHLWGGAWWLWHVINIAAFLLLLLYFNDYIEEKKKHWMEGKIDDEKIKFVATFEQAAVGMAIVAPNGSWLRVNHKLSEIVGYSYEELLALTFQDITHPDDLDADLQYVHEMLIRERTNYTMRKRYIHKNGSIVWIDLTVSLIWKEDETPDFFIAVIVDANREVKDKEKIITLNAELEHKVIERTAALQNAYDEMEAFTYSVSHDLRSPLRATDGFSQALLEDYGDKLDATAQDYLSRIRSASQKMGGLIDDLLQLSRQTRTAMVPTSIDLGVIAHQIISELSRQSPERKVDFTINGDVSAYADINLMHIVLDNLIGNAWKYTSLHKDAIIEFGSMIENGEKIFYIRDNGAGFDMSYADKLFKPFQRLHTVQEFAGNGIGLAMVYRIIKRHFGRVWAQGEIEKGATFFFTLGLNISSYQSIQEQ